MPRLNLAISALAACALAIACSPSTPEAPSAPPVSEMRIEALNSVQLARMVRDFGPPGILCQNASRVDPMGVVPENAPNKHAAHVGARAYSILCTHPDLVPNDKDPNQQWVIWVTSVDPVVAVVDRCFEEGQSNVGDNICWDALMNPEAIR